MQFLRSSIFRKQIIAITGLLLVGFILGHLAGNLTIFGGPDALNGYAKKLSDLGPLLWVARIGLILAAIVHIAFTVHLYIENKRARGEEYAVYKDFGYTSFAKKTMILSGLLLFFFLFLHLSDFTFADKYGDPSVVAGYNNDESLGLFGVVWNSFLQPWRVLIYILAMASLGMHLSHGIQSFLQTLGLNDEHLLNRLEKASLALAVFVAVAYSIIPIYVIIRHYTVGPI